MKFPLHTLIATSFLGLVACSPSAAPTTEMAPLEGDWTVNNDGSHISFVSVKAGTIAEAHSFGEIEGSILADGSATIEIPLASVKTNIDLRDERMRDVFFETATYPTATVTAQLDPAAFADLGIGESVSKMVTAKLDLHGESSEVDAALEITRIGADKVLVMTTAPVIIDVADFDLTDGVEKLRELAGLSAITPAVPVTFSLLLTR